MPRAFLFLSSIDTLAGATVVPLRGLRTVCVVPPPRAVRGRMHDLWPHPILPLRRHREVPVAPTVRVPRWRSL